MADISSSSPRLESLRALQDELAEAFHADKGPQKAALARQIREVMRDIDEIERGQGRKGSIVDELADRRKNREPDTADQPAPAKRGAKQR